MGNVGKRKGILLVNLISQFLSRLIVHAVFSTKRHRVAFDEHYLCEQRSVVGRPREAVPSGMPMEKSARVAGWRCFQGDSLRVRVPGLKPWAVLFSPFGRLIRRYVSPKASRFAACYFLIPTSYFCLYPLGCSVFALRAMKHARRKCPNCDPTKAFPVNLHVLPLHSPSRLVSRDVVCQKNA